MLKKIINTVAATLLTTQAYAAPIFGDIQFIGNANVTRTANQFSTIGWKLAVVGIANGAFAAEGVNSFDPVTFVNPWTVAAPTPNFWSVGGFSFNLLNIQTNNGTTLYGTGTINHTGYDVTEGFWEFTSQGTESGLFTWSSSTTVAEPGTLILLAAGLLSIGLIRRKQTA